ncbi:MAG: CARDB domain-containing protein, partial [Candidatus Thermoplasmatota archaeon]|nr:CARDB domain-containing protein [Candidatus Thermoplasmatota archaeon]
MGRRSSAHVVCVFLLLIPVLTALQSSASETVGTVIFSSEGISLSPSEPEEGGSVTFTVNLQNNASIEANNVEVEFHKSTYVNGEPELFEFISSIPANDFASVDFTWSNLQYGTQVLFVKVSHAGESEIISKSFDVSGLPNLRFSHFALTPSSGAHQGDTITVETQIENAGNADSTESSMALSFPGTSASDITVPGLTVGSTWWFNTTGTAPATGTYDVSAYLNSDSADNVIESSMVDNEANETLTVVELPDYSHSVGPLADATPGSLNGPWTVSGTIERTGGSGQSTVPLQLSILNGIALEIISLDFNDADVMAEYQFDIEVGDLTNSNPGDTALEIEIDPSKNTQQSNTFNDVEQTIITIHEEPNVRIISVSSNPPSVGPGESVTLSVNLQNSGVIPVNGVLSVSFDGSELTPKTVIIPASSSSVQGQSIVTFNAPASGGDSRNIPFTATWTKDSNSYDRLTDDNTASGFVVLNSDLKLRFLETTEDWNPGLPLHPGYEYVYSITVKADQSSGSETFVCKDTSRNTVFDQKTLIFDEEGDEKLLSCNIDIDEGIRGKIELTITASGGSTSPHSKNWNVEESNSESSAEENKSQTAMLLIIGGLLATAALVAAVILTRRGRANAERETWDICPACEGEIEGNEDTCPHCDLDLDKALSKFHDCSFCNANIPSISMHCPYCGSEQDVETHYERRERKYKPLPEEIESVVETEPEEDFDEIVRGSESFEDQVSEMGFDEEQWEGEWDSKLDEAETYFDEQEAAKVAAEEEEMEAIEADDSVGETELSQVMDDLPSHDLDAFLGDVKSRRHVADEDVELSASDANYREQLFEMTGEDGVLPGESVNVEAMVDNTVVG